MYHNKKAAMEINFKGFQNTGIGVDINKYPQQILKSNGHYIKPPYVHLSLTTTLNNIGDNDREIFGEILKKFPNRHQKDTINFHYDKYYSQYSNQYKKEFWLNDKPLILRDDNLKIFSKLAQLFTKLSNTRELPTDKFYLHSNDCRANFNYFFMQGKTDRLPEFHKPEAVRKNAQNMVKEFTDIMLDYFNS